MVAGFCGETEEEHADTLRLMQEVQFDQAYMYAYSLRDRTHAAHRMEDDVSAAVKQRRLSEIIEVYRSTVQSKNEREELGQSRVVLVEGESTKSTAERPSLTGRTDGNKRVVFESAHGGAAPRAGDYVRVRVTEVRGSTLRAELLGFTNLRGEVCTNRAEDGAVDSLSIAL